MAHWSWKATQHRYHTTVIWLKIMTVVILILIYIELMGK